MRRFFLALGLAASTVAPVAAAPAVVRRAPAVSQTALPVRPSIDVKKQIDAGPCEGPKEGEPTVQRLSRGVLLWQAPCALFAYNAHSLMILSDERGADARLLPLTLGEQVPGVLVNARYDPKTRFLEAFEKTRGVGDCGVFARWVWTGRAFALIETRTMETCRGLPLERWPVVRHAVLAPGT